MRLPSFCAGMIFGVMLVALWQTAPSRDGAQVAARPQPQQCGHEDGEEPDAVAIEWAGR